MVLYLKYRPQSLTDLSGQETVVKTLKAAFDNDKLSHAYLFCGPRGVGKTSTARILAKMVNCLDSGKDKPCNKCQACLSIANGSALDLIEIDAASNRGIDDVRELREKIKLSPSSLKKKVYIIDEVHMLTNEAFNALLKTLEEPPAHVLFILATTEPQKIPQTILSRVTRINFKGADLDGLVETLSKIAEAEKIKVDKEALTLLAKKSDGSFRDGVKLLDQIASQGEKITVELVEENLKGGKFESVVKLTQALASKDIKGSLGMINNESLSGTHIKEYLYSVMDIFRSMLLIKQGAMDLVEGLYFNSQYQEVLELSKSFQVDQLVRFLNLFQEAYEKLKVTSVPTLPLEIAVVEGCQPSAVSGEVSEIVLAQETVILSPKDEGSPKVALGDSSAAPQNDSVENESVQKPRTSSKDLILLQDKWSYILETIRQSNMSLEALLRSVVLAQVDGDVVIFKVPYSFHQRILEAPKNRDLLEFVLTDVLQRTVKVGCILDQRPIRVEELANVEVAADDEIIKLASEIFSS